MRRGRSTDIVIGLGERARMVNEGIVIVIGVIDRGLKAGKRKMARNDGDRIDGGTRLRNDVTVTMPPRRDLGRTIGLLNGVFTMRRLRRRVVEMIIHQSVHDKIRCIFETSIESNCPLESTAGYCIEM
jgi:hypothetical protein